MMFRITPMMVTTKPDHQGEREGNRKNHRAGMPDCSGVLVVTNARAFYTTRAAAGALASGIPRAFF
jgi:hypothetical protein